MSERGLRYNTGKNKLQLVPTELIEGVGKVLTYGANKYTVRDEKGEVVIDGANNWRKGLSWTDTYGSLQRHLNEFIKGEDVDHESGCLHLEHAATNIAFLLNFYKNFPQGDDRIMKSIPKIGLDIDEVVCDFLGHWCKINNLPPADCWGFDPTLKYKFDIMELEGTLEEFMLSLPPLIKPEDIPFEPFCYITSRRVDSRITYNWLAKHKFPLAPVYTVPVNTSKLEIAKKSGIDIFVDDKYETFIEFNSNGLCCYLMDATHNQKYNVGYKRIKSLKELV